MINIRKMNTASFDVDAQNCFTPVCPDELPVPEGNNIVSELNAQAQFCRVRVGSKDAHSPQAIWAANADQPQFSPVDGENVDIRWNMHGVPGTKGFELIEGLPKYSDYDFFVWKGIELDAHPYGACYQLLDDTLSTGVIEYLKCNEVSSVIVGGLATEFCVKLTVLQLIRGGFKVIVNLAACRGIEQDAVAIAIQELNDAGAVIINSTNDLAEG